MSRNRGAPRSFNELLLFAPSCGRRLQALLFRKEIGSRDHQPALITHDARGDQHGAARSTGARTTPPRTAELGDWYDETTSTQTTSTERLRKRITELQRLKAASYEEKLLGRITEHAWRAHNDRWQQELDELEHALAASTPTLQREEFLAAAHRPIALAQAAARQYLTQNATEKREVLRALLSNCTMNDGTLTVTMRSPYGALAKMRESGDWLGDRDSNPDSSVQSRLSYH